MVKLNVDEGRLSQTADEHEERRCLCKYFKSDIIVKFIKFRVIFTLKNYTIGTELVGLVHRYVGFGTPRCFHSNWWQSIVGDG